LKQKQGWNGYLAKMMLVVYSITKRNIAIINFTKEIELINKSYKIDKLDIHMHI
jgi:hypothetical protein